jgi:hypothetical protein
MTGPGPEQPAEGPCTLATPATRGASLSGRPLSRLRAVAEAKEAEKALLRAGLDAERELRRRLELRLAEPVTEVGDCCEVNWVVTKLLE